ncbi:helix-turn-helix transcriptional regulator [Stappia sp. F7233]|uniref:Helix-turn-helix transcriptional regulator n=1 Tax=Stappia albiluteola TaxID=2758565 RepID=A0A839AB98_9HYPH|nr:helix-turn-helix transcriptional regulator [Stappia albiluteola]MBA5776456.1 helix-turn-helix transcriptional regulator [Stappia albiluteola]
MDKLHRRLRWARLQAGCDSAKEGAVRARVAEGLYAAHEDGTAPFGIPDAQRYAAAFGVSIRWLLIGAGPVDPTPENRIPGLDAAYGFPVHEDAGLHAQGGMAEQAGYFLPLHGEPLPAPLSSDPEPGHPDWTESLSGGLSLLEEAHFRALELERQLMGGHGSLEDFFRIVLKVYNDLITRNDGSSRR